jgi:hypothetical protein
MGILKGLIKNIEKVVLTFTKPSGVTWLVIGYNTGFELNQNFLILTLGIIGIKTWKRVKEKL